MTEQGRIALAARVFTLAVLVSITLLAGEGGLDGVLVLVAMALTMQVLSATALFRASSVIILEGAVTALIAIVVFPANDPVMPYLVIPALLGGLIGGLPGVLRVIVAEAGALLLGWWVIIGGVGDRHLLGTSITWLATGFGLGLLGRAFGVAMHSATDVSYRDALDLLKQLHALSGRLTAGLDPVSLAEEVMAQASILVRVEQAAVFVRGRSGVTSPLRFSQGARTEDFTGLEDWVLTCWRNPVPLVDGFRACVPLSTESQVVAVLVLDCLTPPEPRALSRLSEALGPEAVRLYAAILFDDVRDAATSEERNRLAREVHDGVAQDVASLGYLVDNLSATATDDVQRGQLDVLRREVTRVVGELRHSVFDLRNGVGAGQGLGQSLSTFARHVGSHSDLTVHMRLDESPTRLRPEVEAELLRIAQEAMNNARKHSAGTHLWVSCSVHPPHAEIEVIDDGQGLQAARPDSHGLRIMHERAERIGAALSVSTPAVEGRGTVMRVSVGADAAVEEEYVPPQLHQEGR